MSTSPITVSVTGQALIENEELEQQAERLCRGVAQRLEPALNGLRDDFLSEDYVVYAIHELDRTLSAEQLLAERGDTMAGMLRGERERLSAEERAMILGHHISYLENDLVVPTWNAAVVYDTESGARAALEILEFATRYGCFDRFDDDIQGYAYQTGFGLNESCERDVVSQLVELRRRAADYARRDGRVAADEYFAAEQNARVIRDAEAYYRTMLGSRVESWNLRDRHMNDTLQELLKFLSTPKRPAKLVVWAHNSHLGDARATEMGESGELNLGQLAREAFGRQALLVGFTTHAGTVTAASEWDGPAHRKHVRPALASSYERLFHDAGIRRGLLPLRQDLELASVLSSRRLERAIGVLYLPGSERRSHYFHARLAEQFDYVIHIDETRAVEPLERTALWEAGEVAETFPSGL